MNKSNGPTPESNYLPSSEKLKRANYPLRRAMATIALFSSAAFAGAVGHEFTKPPVEIASSTSTIGQGEGILSAVEGAANTIKDIADIDLSSTEIMDATITAEKNIDGSIQPGMGIEVTVYKGPFGHIDAVGSLASPDNK